MKRPLLVDQRENGRGDYWYVIRGGNRQVLSTSEMYPNRSNAIRAARAFEAASYDNNPDRSQLLYLIAHGQLDNVIRRIDEIAGRAS